MPAHILADKAANGLDILAGPLTATHEEMMRATRLAEMADAANTYLRAVVAAADPPPAWLIRAVEQWLHGSSDPDLADLLRRTGLSNTQAQRQLKHLFGAPPKLLARKYRALRAATRIASGERDWTDYIGDGFYDQSHCIREIKQFTGVTPAAIRRAPSLTPTQIGLTETAMALEI
jgi:AraC-like DNA-binding protein